MPRQYDIEKINNVVKKLQNSKPTRIKTKFSKSETIKIITPTIKKMRKRGFSFEDIVARFSENEIHLKTREVAQLFEAEPGSVSTE